MSDYIVHKAVEARKVVPKARREALTDAYLSACYYADDKYDGCQAVIFVDGEDDVTIQSRTGEEYIGCAPAARRLSQIVGPEGYGRVYFAEAWWPGKDQFNKISGAFRKGVENEKLMLRVFDTVSYSEFDAGYSNESFKDRRQQLEALMLIPAVIPYYDANVCPSALQSPGTFGSAQELCNERVKAGGYDGLVLKNPSGTWTKNKENGDEQVKVKRKLSYDLRVTDFHIGTGGKTGRAVYTITVDFKGKPMGVGSGMPHKLEACPKVGDIVEVEAMDYSSNGLLREPRFKAVRHDKIEPDN